MPADAENEDEDDEPPGKEKTIG